MQPIDSKRFRSMLAGMGRMYGQELDQLVLDAYWLALGDWSLDDFEAGARQLMQTAKFMPRPADFHELRKAGRPTAGEAWSKILECARAGYDEPQLDIPAKRALAAIGGIGAVMRSETDKTHFLEKRFAEHFGAMQDAHDIREAVPLIADAGRRISGTRSIGALLTARESNGR